MTGDGQVTETDFALWETAYRQARMFQDPTPRADPDIWVQDAPFDGRAEGGVLSVPTRRGTWNGGTWVTYGVDNRFGFAGYLWDPFLQLYHVRHRVYDPMGGRWLQRDPIGIAGGWNLYEYVGGDPWGYTDPMGLCRAAAGAGGSGQRGATIGQLQAATDGNCDRMRQILRDPSLPPRKREGYINAMRNLGCDTAVMTTVAMGAAGGAFGGLGHGLAITANAWTFGLISPLDSHAEGLQDAYGHLAEYRMAAGAAEIGREAAIAALTGGAGNVALKAGRWAATARGVYAAGQVYNGVQVGQGLYAAAGAFAQGNVLQGVLLGVTSGVGPGPRIVGPGLDDVVRGGAAARREVSVFRQGTFADDSLGWKGNYVKGQQWATHNPLATPDYAKRYGLPTENTGRPHWVVGGRTEGPFTLRPAPASHNNPSNTGGALEILPRNPNDVTIEWFHMPD